MAHMKKSREKKRAAKVVAKNQVRTFAQVWNGSATCMDAAYQLGIKPRSASCKASLLRASGIKLKMMPRGSASR